MIPPIDLKDLLVVPSECPRWLRLPEDARARSNEVVVEQPLVEGALPALAVQGLQGFSGRGKGEKINKNQ